MFNYNAALIRLLFLQVFTFQVLTLSVAQNWSSLPLNFDQPPRCFYSDTANGLLYIGGNFQSVNGIFVNGIISFDGQNWDSLGSQTQIDPVTVISKFQNKIVIGGFEGIGLWDGQQWEYHQCDGAIWALYPKGNELLVGGTYTTIGSDSLDGLASWDGSNWNDVHGIKNYLIGGHCSVNKIIEYTGEMYVSGNIDLSISLKEIMKWNGSSWVEVAGGMAGGGSAWVSDMEILDGKLYAAGYFRESFGSPGNNIARLDANQWWRMGEGLYPGQVFDLGIYDGKLFAVGSFSFCDGVSALRIAYWADNYWCILPGANDNAIGDLIDYQDTLYITGGFKVLDGDSIRFIAKWTGGNYVDTCVYAPIGIPEKITLSQITLSPNPTSGLFTLNVNTPTSSEASIEIYDAMGRFVGVRSCKILPAGQSENKIDLDLSGQAAGLYFVNVVLDDANRATKIIVKE